MEIKNLICIGCPMGCALHVEIEQGSILSVTGNSCPRGDTYARKEVTNPTRIVTTTVRVSGGEYPVVSVKTQTDIPKKKIRDCIEELRNIETKAPVQIGDVVVENIANTGVDMIATKNIATKNR